MREFLKNWGVFTFFILLFFGLRLFVITPVSVQGHSMDPTLADGQKLFTLQHSTIQRFDIITMKEPDELDKLAVKRVIGLPGDTLSMVNDVLTINGEVVDEPYLAEFQQEFAENQLYEQYAYDEGYQELASQAASFTKDFEVTVPAGSYFVLGDNRLISKDSLIFGFVDESLITGEAFFRYWPLNDFGFLN